MPDERIVCLPEKDWHDLMEEVVRLRFRSIALDDQIAALQRKRTVMTKEELSAVKGAEPASKPDETL